MYAAYEAANARPTFHSSRLRKPPRYSRSVKGSWRRSGRFRAVRRNHGTRTRSGTLYTARTKGQPNAAARDGDSRFPRATPAGGAERKTPTARPGACANARDVRNADGAKMNATGMPARIRRTSRTSYRGKNDIGTLIPRRTNEAIAMFRRGSTRSITYPLGIWNRRIAS